MRAVAEYRPIRITKTQSYTDKCAPSFHLGAHSVRYALGRGENDMETSVPVSENAVNPYDHKIDPLSRLSAYEHGWLPYHPAVARALGSVNAAVLLHKMLKWAALKDAKRRFGWFYAGRDQITDETGLTRDNQETARKLLASYSVLEETLRGTPASGTGSTTRRSQPC